MCSHHGSLGDPEQEFVNEHGHVGEITAGTVLEYDDWQWAVVSEIADDREKPMVGFILLDELDDDVTKRLERANGCREHYRAVLEFRGGEHEYWTSIDYMVNDDIWTVLGPVHPDYRDGDSDE